MRKITATTVKGRKAKGRALQNAVALALRHYSGLNEDDVKPAIMGDTGTDIKLSSKAKQMIPFDIECKAAETARPWDWLKQAEKNTTEGRVPLVVFRRARSKTYAMIEFDALLDLLKK